MKKRVKISLVILAIVFLILLVFTLKIMFTGYAVQRTTIETGQETGGETETAAKSVSGVFVRGDVNEDGRVDMADPIVILNFLFSGGKQPECLDAADVNDDSVLTIGDAVRLLNFLFSGGSAPSAPYPVAGRDLTEDGLSCGGGIEVCERGDKECCMNAYIIKKSEDSLTCYLIDTSALSSYNDIFSYKLISTREGSNEISIGYSISLTNGDIIYTHNRLSGLDNKMDPVTKSVEQLYNEFNQVENDNFKTLVDLFRKRSQDLDSTPLFQTSFEDDLNYLVERNLLKAYVANDFDEKTIIYTLYGLSGDEDIFLTYHKPEYSSNERIVESVKSSLANSDKLADFSVSSTGNFLTINFETVDGEIATKSFLVDTEEETILEDTKKEDVENIMGLFWDTIKSGQIIVFSCDDCFNFVDREDLGNIFGEDEKQTSVAGTGMQVSASERSCTDPDSGGRDFEKKGAVNYIDSYTNTPETFTDYCMNDLTLKEGMCDVMTKTLKVISEFCPDRAEGKGKCVDGACVESNLKCFDTDGGVNYLLGGGVYSKISGKRGQMKVDYCASVSPATGEVTDLFEWYCDEDDLIKWKPRHDCTENLKYNKNCEKDFTGFSACLEKDTQRNIGRSNVIPEVFKLPKSNDVLLFYDREPMAEYIFGLMSRESLPRLGTMGYELKPFSFDISSNQFSDFYKAWEKKPEGIVIWLSHGFPNGIDIGTFRDVKKLENMEKELETLGFVKNFHFMRGFGGHGRDVNNYMIILTNEGIKKFKSKQAVTILGACYGQTVAASINSNIVYFSYGKNPSLNAVNYVDCLLEGMTGYGGIDYLNSIASFDKYCEKIGNVAGLFEVSPGVFVERRGSPGRFHNDHTNPEDMMDYVLNPYIREAGFMEGEGRVRFGTRMDTSTQPILFLEPVQGCPNAVIVMSDEKKPKWQKLVDTPSGAIHYVPNDYYLTYNVDWNVRGSEDLNCKAKVIFNPIFFQGKYGPFPLNGKRFNEAGFCLQTRESQKQEGRACAPLGGASDETLTVPGSLFSDGKDRSFDIRSKWTDKDWEIIDMRSTSTIPP